MSPKNGFPKKNADTIERIADKYSRNLKRVE